MAGFRDLLAFLLGWHSTGHMPFQPTADTVLRRAASTTDTTLRRAPSAASDVLRRAPGSSDDLLRRW